MEKVLWIMAAGAVGTLSRYWLGGFVQEHSGSAFPWGTMVVNLLGCFVFGLVWTLAEDRLIISGETRRIVLTGFMGAFTTFSTFMFETTAFMQDGQYLAAAANLVAQNGLGIVAMLLGLGIGRMLF